MGSEETDLAYRHVQRLEIVKNRRKLRLTRWASEPKILRREINTVGRLGGNVVGEGAGGVGSGGKDSWAKRSTSGDAGFGGCVGIRPFRKGVKWES